LDPFAKLNAYVKDLYQQTLKLFQNIIVNPPHEKPGGFLDYLYGSSLGLAGQLSIAISIFVIVGAMFWQRRLRSIPHAFIVVFAIGACGELFFPLCDWLYSLGYNLAKAAQFYHPKGGGSSLFATASIDNVLGSILGLGTIAFNGYWLLMMIIGYVVLIFAVKFLMLPVLALSPLGPRSQAALSVLISGGLVSLVVGRAAAVLMLELSRMAIDLAPFGGTTVGLVTYSLIGIWAAIAVQFVLMYICYQQAHRIVGNVMSKVTGKVESFFTRSQKVDVRTAMESHQRSFRGPVGATEPSFGQRVVRDAKHDAIRIGAKHATTKIAGTAAGPIGVAAVTAGSMALRKRADETAIRNTQAKAARRAVVRRR
jgi:hypothetical protein